MTTIGYGDFKPFSESDRLFFCLIFGAGIIFYTLIFDKIRDYIGKVFQTSEQMEAQAASEMKDYIEDVLAYGYKAIKNRKNNSYDVFKELCKNFSK